MGWGKKEAFWASLAQGSPEAGNRYWQAWRPEAAVVMDAKTWVWEEFGEAMEKGFRLASRRFWQTFRHSGRATPAVKGLWPLVVPQIQDEQCGFRLYPRKTTRGVLGVCSTSLNVLCGLGEGFRPGPWRGFVRVLGGAGLVAMGYMV